MDKSWEEGCWCKTRSEGRGREFFNDFTLTEDSVMVTNPVFPGDVCASGQAPAEGSQQTMCHIQVGLAAGAWDIQ